MTTMTLGCHGARIGLDMAADVADRVAVLVVDVAAPVDDDCVDATVTAVRQCDDRWAVTSESDEVVVAAEDVDRAVVDEGLEHLAHPFHGRGAPLLAAATHAHCRL